MNEVWKQTLSVLWPCVAGSTTRDRCPLWPSVTAAFGDSGPLTDLSSLVLDFIVVLLSHEVRPDQGISSRLAGAPTGPRTYGCLHTGSAEGASFKHPVLTVVQASALWPQETAISSCQKCAGPSSSDLP